MTLTNPLGLIHVEMARALGNVRWAAEDIKDERIPFKLGSRYPRCFACELTDDRGIIPAFGVTSEGVPVCLAHIKLGGMGFEPLLPPCAICGQECAGKQFEDENGNYQYGTAYSVDNAPVVGYLCAAHADRGIRTPDSQATWKWNPTREDHRVHLYGPYGGHGGPNTTPKSEALCGVAPTAYAPSVAYATCEGCLAKAER